MELINIQMTVDFKQMCRLCMRKKSNMLPLFIGHDNLSEKILNFIPSMKLSIEDGLPAQVCLQCVQQVNQCCSFKLQCETTAATLRQLLNTRQNQDENDGCINVKQEPDMNVTTEDKVKQEPDVNITIEEDPLHFETSDHLGEQHTFKLETISIASIIQDRKTDLNAENIKGLDASNLTSPEMKKNIVCKECGKEFLHHNELLQHTVTHKGEKKHICRFCGKSYYFRNSLVTHYKTHPDEKPYECNKCEDKFSNVGDLRKHSELHGMKFVCPVCGKFLGNNGKLKVHMFIHTGEKPYICKICGKAYNNKESLNFHAVTHTGERLHLCEVCGACFARYSSLRVHVYSHSDGRRKFACDQCGKNFLKKEKLRLHILSHTGEKSYACKECNKTFLRKDTLLNHERLHAGNLPVPFACSICGKRFDRKYRLQEHVVTHSECKPYYCEHCGKGFMKTTYLKNHLINIHDITV